MNCLKCASQKVVDRSYPSAQYPTWSIFSTPSEHPEVKAERELNEIYESVNGYSIPKREEVKSRGPDGSSGNSMPTAMPRQFGRPLLRSAWMNFAKMKR